MELGEPKHLYGTISLDIWCVPKLMGKLRYQIDVEFTHGVPRQIIHKLRVFHIYICLQEGIRVSSGKYSYGKWINIARLRMMYLLQMVLKIPMLDYQMVINKK